MTALGDFLFVLTVFCAVLALCGGLVERRRRKDLLPAPDDPRLRNANSIRQWEQKRALVERYAATDFNGEMT